MTILRNQSRLTALLCVASMLILVSVALAQNPPPQQPQQPVPGMQGMRQPAGPGMGMRGPRMAMRAQARLNRAPRPGRAELARLLRNPEIQKQLNITDEQRKKLEDIGFNGEKSTIQDRANLEVRRLELRRLMQADNPDRAAIEKKLQEVGQAQTALERARVNSMLDVRAVLTKEQQDKLREIARQRMAARRPRPMNQPGMMRPGMMRPGMNNAPAPKKPAN